MPESEAAGDAFSARCHVAATAARAPTDGERDADGERDRAEDIAAAAAGLLLLLMLLQRVEREACSYSCSPEQK